MARQEYRRVARSRRRRADVEATEQAVVARTDAGRTEELAAAVDRLAALLGADGARRPAGRSRLGELLDLLDAVVELDGERREPTDGAR